MISLKMFDTKSLLISIGANAVAVLSDRVSLITTQTRFTVEEDSWPPKQPKQFTPLLFIHHQGQHTIKTSTTLAKLQSGGITSADSVSKCYQLDSYESLREILDVSRMTKNVVDILAPLEESSDPQFIFLSSYVTQLYSR